jgi:endonuclease/exonuclease/phosphatase family metal-dependent hydrolase
LGFVLAWGSDRQPADATKPIIWQTPTASRPAATNVLRIASFNIHGGKGTDGKLDLARIAGELKDVDLAGLFEVHSAPWHHPSDQAAVLGEQLDMRSAFLGTEHRWWHDHFGNAVLAAWPIEHVQRIPLVGTRGKAFRQAVLVDVPLQDQIVHVVMAHLDRGQDREQQLAAVIALFQSLAAPAILMGDLNSGVADPQLTALLSQADIESVIHAKMGSAAPPVAIDWIITRGLECDDVEYRSSGASDHPVIKATLRLLAH